MKVLLFHPQFEIYFTHEAPIGLAYLQAVLRKKGHQTEVLDNNVLQLGDEEVIGKAKNFDIIAISMTTPTFATVKRICGKIKKETETKIVLGGAHPTIDPLSCLDFSDFVVMGEGEESFPELLEKIEKSKTSAGELKKTKSKKKIDARELKKIKGIAFKLNGKKHENKRREFIKNLDELPFPDWANFPLEKYGSALRVSKRSLPIVTSRGCPYNCIYCFKGLFGREFRARSPKSVADELEYLKKNFGIREFQIADDAFAADRQRAIDICKEIIKRKINMKWSLPNGIRASSLSDELVGWMKKSGLDYAGLGIESGNQKILDNCGKSQTLEQVRTAVKLLKKHKITTVGFFMFGLPGETEKTMKETIDFAKSLKLDYCSISMTTPYPGTRLFEEIKKGKGKLLIEKPEDLFSLGSKCKYVMPEMAEPKVIEETYRKARKELLLNPRTILKTLKNPKRMIAGARVAYKWLLKT